MGRLISTYRWPPAQEAARAIIPLHRELPAQETARGVIPPYISMPAGAGGHAGSHTHTQINPISTIRPVVFWYVSFNNGANIMIG